MSNLRLAFDAILNFVKKKKKTLDVCEICTYVLQFMFTCQANQNETWSLFSFVCQEKMRSEATYQIALPCLTLQSHRWALFRPPRSSKQISEPDKSTVLFFPVTNPSSKRRAESLHQPLVMAMKWTGACVGATAAAPSQHANVAPEKPAQRRPNKTALKLIWLSYSCLLLDIMLMQHCSTVAKRLILYYTQRPTAKAAIYSLAFASFNHSHRNIRRFRSMKNQLDPHLRDQCSSCSDS